MRVLLTGGAGDLGQMLCSSLIGMGHTPVVFDIKAPPAAKQAAGAIPSTQSIEYINGSIINREQLRSSMAEVDTVVHIAAWHGIHEHRKEKDAYDFWDLNATGTFNVFQSATECGVNDIVFVSSTSIDDRYGIYGHSKIIGEELARAYADRHAKNIITLRPRAFIPPWNKSAYSTFIEWAKWYWKGAVHISDVNQSVVKSIEFLSSQSEKLKAPLFLTVDGAYQYTEEDLENWDAEGPGSTFRNYYNQFYELAVSLGFDPTLKPKRLDISDTTRLINYRPLYSLKTLLLELKMYGAEGPYADRQP